MTPDMLGGVSAAREAMGQSAPQPAVAPTGGEESGFGAMLTGLSAVQGDADLAVQELAVGGDGELHDAVLAVEMESIAFELAVQIRNRLVDAYQEVFRMSI